MGIIDSEDNMTINCSPIVNYKGNEIFLVSVYESNEETGSLKCCGVQFPQRHINFAKGYTKKEVEDIVDMLSKNEKELKKEASMMPPLPADICLDDYGFI